MRKALAIGVFAAYLLSCFIAYQYGHAEGYVKAANELTTDAKNITQVLARARLALQSCQKVQDLD